MNMNPFDEQYTWAVCPGDRVGHEAIIGHGPCCNGTGLQYSMLSRECPCGCHKNWQDGKVRWRHKAENPCGCHNGRVPLPLTLELLMDLAESVRLNSITFQKRGGIYSVEIWNPMLYYKGEGPTRPLAIQDALMKVEVKS